MQDIRKLEVDSGLHPRQGLNQVWHSFEVAEATKLVDYIYLWKKKWNERHCSFPTQNGSFIRIGADAVNESWSIKFFGN